MNHDIQRLCNIWNHATAPYKMRSDIGHVASRKLARKIMTLIKRHGEYRRVNEYSNGGLWVSHY